MAKHFARPFLLIMIAICLAGCGAETSKRSGGSSTELPSREGSEIEGQVMLVGSSDASGIQVFIPGTSALAMTDENGNFLLRGLSSGKHNVSAQKFGYETARVGTVEIAENAPPKRYVLAAAGLEATGGGSAAAGQFGSVRGKIILGADMMMPDDSELGDCRVELSGTGMKTVVEDDGSFFIWNVRAGDYTLIAHVPGFPDYRVSVKVMPSDEPAEVEILISGDEIELEPREITGNIELVQLNGDPATDYGSVVITIKELPGRKISPAVDGTFQIGSLARRVYTIQAAAEGYAPSLAETIDLTDIAQALVTLTLFQAEPGADEPGAIGGHAYYDDETITNHSGIQVALAGTSFMATTNAAGEYVITGVAPGIYEIIAQASGYESAEALEVEVVPSDETLIEDLYLAPIRDYPVVVSTNPVDGTDDFLIRYEMPIMVRFSKKMDATTLKESVVISPEAPVSLFIGREHPLSDYDMLVVMLDGSNQDVPVKYGTQYELTILDGTLDTEGLALQEPYTMQFRTSKPGVMDTRPAEGDKNAAVNSSNPVYFRFNAGLDYDSIDARDIRIKPGITGVPTVNYYDDPKTGWTTIEIQSQWREDTSYEVTLPRRIKTATGQSLSNTPYKLEFRTAKNTPISVPGTSSGAMRMPRVSVPR